MAKGWKCAHCATVNPDTTLTCTNCRRIRGSVVVPPSSVASPGEVALPEAPPAWKGDAPGSVPLGNHSLGAGSPASAGTAGAVSPRRIRLALAGSIALVVAAFVGGLIASSGANAPRTTPAPRGLVDSPQGHDVSVLKLRIGDCFDYKTGHAELVDVVIAGPCAEAHHFELFHVVSLPSGAYPGTDWIEESARALCQPVFEEYVGTAYDDSELDFTWIYPNEDAWFGGDRTIQCFAFQRGYDLLAGSVKGSKR